MDTAIVRLDDDGGSVSDVIVGGNNTNWFGTTIIGVDAGDGTYKAADGDYGIRLVIGGTTKVNEGALVAGGSYVDYAYEYQKIVDGVDVYGRVATIYGNTFMELTGDSVISTDVYGGSYAYYEQVDFSTDVSKLSAPNATQYGNIDMIISGNTTITGNVYGGGAGFTNTEQVKTVSATEGDVVISITGGNILGGVYAAGENGIITGDAVLNFDNASVYNTAMTVINGFDEVNFNGEVVNFANVAFQDTVIKVSDVPLTPGQVVTFATGTMTFDDATRFRIGDELYQLGVIGKDGYVFNYDGSGLVVEQKEVQADTSVFYVNSEWFGMADGSVVEINGEYYSIGINAFGNLGDALSSNCNAADDTTGTTVKLMGDISFKETTTEWSDFEYALSNNLNITADNPVVIDITKPLDSSSQNYELILISKDSENPVTVTFGENVTVNTNAKIWLGRENSAVNYVIDGSIIQTAKEEAQSGILQIQLCEKSTAILNGSISGAQYGFQISGGTFTVSDTGKLSVGTIAIESGRNNAHDVGMFIVDGSKNVTGAALTINERLLLTEVQF